jgi:peptidoglycan-associated lipoprotein
MTKPWFSITLAAAAAAVALAGCGSSVKLDETPVESRTPATTAGSDLPGSPATRSGAGAGPAPQSQVATVDLNRGPVGGATADALAASLGRTVYFDFDSFVVKDDFRSLIEGHARLLAANKSRRMVIEGHTDERGGSEYNLALGQKRAEAVLKSLVLLGAADGQLEAVSYGKERPVDPASNEAAWAKNRRAELKDR